MSTPAQPINREIIVELLINIFLQDPTQPLYTSYQNTLINTRRLFPVTTSEHKCQVVWDKLKVWTDRIAYYLDFWHSLLILHNLPVLGVLWLLNQLRRGVVIPLIWWGVALLNLLYLWPLLGNNLAWWLSCVDSVLLYGGRALYELAQFKPLETMKVKLYNFTDLCVKMTMPMVFKFCFLLENSDVESKNKLIRNLEHADTALGHIEDAIDDIERIWTQPCPPCAESDVPGVQQEAAVEQPPAASASASLAGHSRSQRASTVYNRVS